MIWECRGLDEVNNVEDSHGALCNVVPYCRRPTNVLNDDHDGDRIANAKCHLEL